MPRPCRSAEVGQVWVVVLIFSCFLPSLEPCGVHDKDKDSVELPCNEPRNDFTLAMLIRLGRVKRESPLAMGDYYLDARRTPNTQTGLLNTQTALEATLAAIC